jgi:hypothetical protein
MQSFNPVWVIGIVSRWTYFDEMFRCELRNLKMMAHILNALKLLSVLCKISGF